MSGPDEARDAHLREALRHAPDARLQAPPALGEFILKEARAKARDPKPVDTPTTGWARHVWDWLARPAVATGFAGVMAATLVGLMWWDQPMDEALPRSPVPAAAPAPEKAAPAASAPVDVPSSPPNGSATTAPKPDPVRKKAADAPHGAQSRTAAAPVRTDAPPAPRQEAAERDTRGPTADSATAGAAAEVTRPAPPATPAPVTMSPAPAAVPVPPTRFADTTTTEALAKARVQEEETKRERSSMAPAEAQSRRAAAKLQLNESRLQGEAEAYTRVASVRAAIASEATRWAWQRAHTTSQPMNDAVYAWLAQLDSSAGTGWQPRSARETAAPRGRALALLRDGTLQHSFQLTERGVLWQRGQTAWHIELPADTLTALQAAMDSATP